MEWNWTLADWPNFTYDAAALEVLERRFLVACGEVVEAVRHATDDERNMLRIELLSEEAVKTSEIEGETLDRLNVQASLRSQLGLVAESRPVTPQEHGIAEMMVDVLGSYDKPLDHDTLFRWHGMMMAGSRHITAIGSYRTHADAMQIVSGRLDAPTVHFEAPPTEKVRAQMDAYVKWFNDSAPHGERPLPALARAGIGHLYFESVHPFEDGNGRLGRVLAERSLAQNIGQPTLISLASTIARKRNAYYDHLGSNQKTLEVTDWVTYFAETILEAQQTTLKLVAFYVGKARFYARYRGVFNERQEKVLARMFREGPSGFKGGLSADNYIAITRTSRVTAATDLLDLVDKAALTRTGENRQARYFLNLPEVPKI